MSHMVEIPEGDGTPALKQIHRNWMKVCQEILMAVREERVSFSRGVEAFAETVMFEGAEPGEKTNASANVMITLEALLKHNFNATFQLGMSPNKFEGNGASAVLLLSYEGKSAELTFSNVPPYARIIPGAATPQTRKLPPSTATATPSKTNNEWNDWDQRTQNSRDDRAQQQAQWQSPNYPPQHDEIVRPPDQPPMNVPARFRGAKPVYKSMNPYDRPRRPLPPATVEVETIPFDGGGAIAQRNFGPPRPLQNSRLSSMNMWQETDAAAVPAPAPLDPDSYWRKQVNPY